ncbi:MAG: SPOR domain-containing protein [Thermodesulfobacteriota bacterium]
MKQSCGKATNQPDEDEPFLQLSRKRAAGWAAAVLFISAWTFVLGVLVGRGTAPVHFDMDRLQKELLALKSQVLEKERESIREDAEALAERPAVDFYDVLKEEKIDPSVSLPPPPAPSQPKSPPKPPETAAAPVVPTKEEKPVKTAAKDIKPKPKTLPVEKKPVADSLKKSVLDNPETFNQVIQVAATRDSASADQLVLRLKKSGYPAFIVAGQNAKKENWYRVRIRGFSNREEAVGKLAAIRREFPGALLINR